MFVIKNVTDKPVELDNGVMIDPKQQLEIQMPTRIMRDAQARGDLQIKDATETPAELKADVEAMKPVR